MTITRFENDQSRGYADTIARLRAAFEGAGIEFIEQNGGGPGVRLRKPI